MQNEDSGFFRSLFDWDFKEFLSLRFIKGLYIIWVIIIGAGTILTVGYSVITGSLAQKILSLIFGPLIAIFVLLVIRLLSELNVIFFRIERHLRKMSNSE